MTLQLRRVSRQGNLILASFECGKRKGQGATLGRSVHLQPSLEQPAFHS